MNQVYLEGSVANAPRLLDQEGAAPRLIFSLVTTHRSKAGVRKEYYPIRAWNQLARFGAQRLTPGTRVVVEGYLTQQVRTGGRAGTGDGAAVSFAEGSGKKRRNRGFAPGRAGRGQGLLRKGARHGDRR